MGGSTDAVSEAYLDSARRSVLSGRFVASDRFLSMYDNGLHSNRMPGCYVILVYKGRIASRKPESYLKGYVGQSVNVFRRVHKHLSGGGNANIFEDVKAGRRVMVQIVPCSSDSLNDMERLLIAAMDRGRLYNMTDGGALWRCHDRSEFILADRRLSYRWDSKPAVLCRTLASCYGGKRRIRLEIDGIPVSYVSDGSLISFDLPEGRHSVRASRLGKRSGRTVADISDGCEIVVTAGRFKIDVRSLRRRRRDSAPVRAESDGACKEFSNTVSGRQSRHPRFLQSNK